MLCLQPHLRKSISHLTLTFFSLVFSEIAQTLQSFEMFVDIAFMIDILLNFVKLPPNLDTSDDGETSLQQLMQPAQDKRILLEKKIDKQLKRVQCSYLKTYFLIDCVATLPGLVTLQHRDIFYFKLLRLVHWDRLFTQLNIIFEKVLLSWLTYNRHKVGELITFTKLIVFVFLMTHYPACGWIKIGRLSDDSWINIMQEDKSIYNIYWSAFFFVLTTITTVGYGEGMGSTQIEYIYCMFV